MTLIKTLHQHAINSPNALALASPSCQLSYLQLSKAVNSLAEDWASQHGPIAVAVANHPAWVVLDITAMQAKIPCVPLPFFFSDTQLLHAIMDAGVDTLITDAPARFCALLGDFIVSKHSFELANKRLMQLQLHVPSKSIPINTSKITYTSGTTGQPKGVCLSQKAMHEVANAIRNTAHIGAQSQHLAVLPLSTLLENVAGVNATLLAGGTVHLLPLHMLGFEGGQFNPAQLHAVLEQTIANTAILTPELLNGLLHVLENGANALTELQFLAVGGAKVSQGLLKRAESLGLPVYEGYGLSECASVVTLNTPGNTKIGSVGKPLPHVQIKLAEDNEVLVRGEPFLGYTHSPAKLSQTWLATGDIGMLDADGYLFIKGRKKNIFITSFGRNVSPEWVESVLLNHTCIRQVCVFGEAHPWNVALIVCRPETQEQDIQAAIDQSNATLPNYAQIKRWVSVPAFSTANQQLTANGRLKRAQIWQAYQATILDVYKETI